MIAIDDAFPTQVYHIEISNSKVVNGPSTIVTSSTVGNVLENKGRNMLKTLDFLNFFSLYTFVFLCKKLRVF